MFRLSLVQTLIMLKACKDQDSLYQTLIYHLEEDVDLMVVVVHVVLVAADK